MSSQVRLQWPRPRVAAFTPDAAQRAVIDHRLGNLRVLAGPGTGKTSVIVEAVRERIRRGQSPEHLLVLTYGRMAAAELRSRLSSDGRPAPVATTFHALAYRLVRGLKPGLRLMGAPEQESVLREIVRASTRLPAELEPARRSRGLTEQLRAYIGRAQSLGHGPEQLGVADPLQAGAAAVYAEYLDVIGFAAAMDYAELIRRATQVIASNPPDSIRALQTVFVDEYQDTDPAQVNLLRHLAAFGAQIIAVGDPDQAVYGFRGADAAGILRFPEEFDGVRGAGTIALCGTRRFGPQIAAVARRVVPRNSLRGVPAGQVQAHRHPDALGDPADRAAFRVYESESAASDHIADLLRRVRSGASEVFPGLQLDWSQMAVLVRSGSRDLPVLQRALLAAGIPAEIARDDLPLAAIPAVRTLLDVLRVAADVDGGLTTERATSLLCSPLAGMAPRAVSRLGRTLRRTAAGPGAAPPGSGELITNCLRNPDLLAGVDEELAEPVTALATVLDMASRRVAEQQPPARILDGVWRATPWPHRLRRDALAGGRRAREANQALDAVMELFEQAERLDDAFESVRSVDTFLAQVCDQIIPAAPNQQKPWNRSAVRLLTAHRAKGSQWPLVVVTGVQEGLWPDLRPRASLFTDPGGQAGWREEQMLAERRLLYVACTRAQRALLVTAVRSAAEDGPQPSPFLGLAAGPEEVVEVAGRPRRPLTPVGVVAGLRQILAEPDTSPAMRSAVWQRLQDLGEFRDAQGGPVFPWADPATWWGHRPWTHNDTPWFDPDAALPVSASGLDSYLRCPRRWFLERRVHATDVAGPRLAFGNLLHLCAQALAGGELAPEEQEVARVLDGVWHAVGYEQGWQARFEREQARQATLRLLTWLRRAPGRYLGSEVEFDTQVNLPSGEVLRVTGKADRVDRVDGSTVITDFKTGAKISQAQAATHLQMGLYRWVAELGGLGASGRAVAQLLFLREDAPRTQAEPGPRLMRQDAADLPEWLLPALEAAAAGMRAELTVARPGDGCRTCVVADSCPADPRGAEVRP